VDAVEARHPLTSCWRPMPIRRTSPGPFCRWWAAKPREA